MESTALQELTSQTLAKPTVEFGGPPRPAVWKRVMCPGTKEFQRSIAMSDLERYLLLALLGPVLWLQGKYVRRVTPRLPEPEGERAGISGHGPLVRILVAGDSAAAGVGASTQDEALCGQLVRHLSEHFTVDWRVVAVNGLDSPGLAKLLEDVPSCLFDVVVLSIGVNDATNLCSPLKWLNWQNHLATVIDERFKPNLLIHSAVAPMHAFTALPQPLRWFMGRWAMEMNRLLTGLLAGQQRRTMHWHPIIASSLGLATDGFHPGPYGYARWAEGLSEHILSANAASGFNAVRNEAATPGQNQPVFNS